MWYLGLLFNFSRSLCHRYCILNCSGRDYVIFVVFVNADAGTRCDSVNRSVTKAATITVRFLRIKTNTYMKCIAVCHYHLQDNDSRFLLNYSYLPGRYAMNSYWCHDIVSSVGKFFFIKSGQPCFCVHTILSFGYSIRLLLLYLDLNSYYI